MRAFIINLDSATDRWEWVEHSFLGTRLELCRVPGVDGAELQLPIPEYAEAKYLRRHGRPTSPGHVGCYLSHVRAMEAFLATDDSHALIGEDDLSLAADFDLVLDSALQHAAAWNILRLTGLGEGRRTTVARLTGPYSLCVGFGRLKGTGAYLLDRRAAARLSAGLLPMWLPIDHALDREWAFGLRAASIFPFPASQTAHDFRSSIQLGRTRKLPAFQRYLTTYPYQAWNETARWLFRAFQYLRARLVLTAAAR